MHRIAQIVMVSVVLASCQVAGAFAQDVAPATTPPLVGASPPVAVDPKANFRETGRFGVIGALTEDMWKGGFVFEHEHWEVQALAHAGFYSRNDRDVHVILKAGGRVALGTLNYFAFGAEGQAHPGSLQDGHHDNGSFQLGPYISLQRYFAATPVMLTLWVNPVLYDRYYSYEPSGAKHGYNGWHVFQTGGFGIAYLF
ncbi:MAG TPA: hypothetical protein VI299_01010 [Polyangiales bacterium]